MFPALLWFAVLKKGGVGWGILCFINNLSPPLRRLYVSRPLRVSRITKSFEKMWLMGQGWSSDAHQQIFGGRLGSLTAVFLLVLKQPCCTAEALATWNSSLIHTCRACFMIPPSEIRYYYHNRDIPITHNVRMHMQSLGPRVSWKWGRDNKICIYFTYKRAPHLSTTI